MCPGAGAARTASRERQAPRLAGTPCRRAARGSTTCARLTRRGAMVDPAERTAGSRNRTRPSSVASSPHRSGTRSTRSTSSRPRKRAMAATRRNSPCGSSQTSGARGSTRDCAPTRYRTTPWSTPKSSASRARTCGSAPPASRPRWKRYWDCLRYPYSGKSISPFMEGRYRSCRTPALTRRGTQPSDGENQIKYEIIWRNTVIPFYITIKNASA